MKQSRMDMKTIFRRRALAVIAVLIAAQFSVASAQTMSAPSTALTVRDIMAEPSIAGMRAESERISPDGANVAYLWSATGRDPRDLYVVATRGGAPRLLVPAVDRPQENRPVRTETRDEARTDERREERVMQRDAFQQAREQSVSAVEWSPDSRRLLFSKGGDLYIINADGTGTARRLTRTAAPEAGARWLAAGRRIMYQSGGNIFVIGGAERVAQARAACPTRSISAACSLRKTAPASHISSRIPRNNARSSCRVTRASSSTRLSCDAAGRNSA